MGAEAPKRLPTAAANATASEEAAGPVQAAPADGPSPAKLAPIPSAIADTPAADTDPAAADAADAASGQSLATEAVAEATDKAADGDGSMAAADPFGLQHVLQAQHMEATANQEASATWTYEVIFHRCLWEMG